MFFSLISIGWGQDNTPPELLDFSISPLVIDLSESPDTSNFSYHVSDDLSGFFSFYIQLSSLDETDGLGREFYLQEGDVLDYSNQVSTEIPTELVPGTWFIKQIRLEDQSENRIYYYTEDLIDLGFQTEFEVINDNSTCDGNGDLNDDGNTNIIDLVFLINCILDDSCIGNECTDIDNDGSINILDVVVLVNLILDQ